MLSVVDPLFRELVGVSDYLAEERLLQRNTLNAGRAGYCHQRMHRAGKCNKTTFEYSGRTTMSLVATTVEPAATGTTIGRETAATADAAATKGLCFTTQLVVRVANRRRSYPKLYKSECD